jgi:hypothetical protein
VWWLGWLWWVPIPFVLSLLLYEGVFWWRGDRAQQLRLDNGRITLVDPLGDDLVVPLDEITVATLYYRQLKLGELEVSIVLGDDMDVRLAMRLLTDLPFEPHPHDVPADVYDVLFGGIAGVFRALAPPARRPRQHFSDRRQALIGQLRSQLPPEVWRRTALRVWPGMEPDIDLFGYYEGPHRGWVVLDGRSWRCVVDGVERTGAIEGWTFGHAVRDAVLFQGLADAQKVETLPLTLVNLGVSTTIAVPAPNALDLAEVEPLTGDLLHTHAPEGAALLWHLLVHTPRDRWPTGLTAMVADRRAIRPDLDTALPG